MLHPDYGCKIVSNLKQTTCSCLFLRSNQILTRRAPLIFVIAVTREHSAGDSLVPPVNFNLTDASPPPLCVALHTSLIKAYPKRCIVGNLNTVTWKGVGKAEQKRLPISLSKSPHIPNGYILRDKRHRIQQKKKRKKKYYIEIRD